MVSRHGRLFHLHHRVIVVVGAEATVVKKDILVFFFFFFFGSGSSSEPLCGEAEDHAPFAAPNSTGATFSSAKIGERAIECVLTGMLDGQAAHVACL